MSTRKLTTNEAAKADPLPTPLPITRILRTWWPLAAGWIVMTAEMPILTAIIARGDQPAINLASWGVVFPIALILASPVMSMLPASTSLCKDWLSYLRVRNYLFGMIATLTLLHILLAFTSLYDLVVVHLIAAPPALVEPARWGLQLMIPWILCLGIRRFNNGILIRYGHARAVTVGALVRLGTDVVVLTLFSFTDSIPGVIIACSTISIGVICEATYSILRVRPVIRNQLKQMPPAEDQVTFPSFLSFYIPLVMTALIQIMTQPLINSGLTRMPNPIDSLAVWPVIHGLILVIMSSGLAYIEAVVVLLDEPHSLKSLRRFTLYLGGGLTAILFVMNVTPLAELWFQQVASLPPALVPMAKQGLWVLTVIPALTVIQSWHQGMLLNNRNTRGITESVVLSLVGTLLVLGLGIQWGEMSGITISLYAVVFGAIIRTLWLWYRTRPTITAIYIKQERLQYA